MLINDTYFVTPLTIPQITQTETKAAVTAFINKYEPELLRKLLGYTLYKEFIAGLQEVVVDAKWTDLLYGKDYGTGKNWRGLITYTDGLTTGTYWPEDRIYIVGGAGMYDPVAGQSELRDPFLKNKQYRVEERGTGTLKSGTEYTLVPDPGGFDKAQQFNNGGVYAISFTAPIPLPAPIVAVPQAFKQSLIANYVYYWYLQKTATTTSGNGEVRPAAKNSVNARPVDKQVGAWNEMADACIECRDYLLNGGTDYGWKDRRYEMYGNAYRRRQNDIFFYKNSLGL